MFPLRWRTADVFHSYFGRFDLDGIEVDFVGDFSVEYRGVRIVWDAAHPCWARLDSAQAGSMRVPVYRLEDLLMFYLALPGEERKIALIADTLRARGFDAAVFRDSIARWPVLREPLTALLELIARRGRQMQSGHAPGCTHELRHRLRVRHFRKLRAGR